MIERLSISLRLILVYGLIFLVIGFLILLPINDLKVKIALGVFLGGLLAFVIRRFIVKPILKVVTSARDASIEVVKGDLTMKLLNEKLENTVADNMRLNASLRNKNEDMEALIYSISHDLRVPLSGIEGYLGLLSEKTKDASPDCARYIGKVKESSDFMNTMIKSLLELSRIEKIEEKSQNVNIGALVQTIQGMLDPELEKRGIKLIIKDKLLPCYGGKNRVQEVFQNLLQNAVKFSKETHGAYIEIGSKKLDDKFIEYRVKDNGIGVEPEEQGKIFSIFYKVRDTGREGHGVGLAIVRKIVAKHGGHLRLESKKGEGTTFFFTLPAAR
ncbi:MAG: hypothetical protein A2231_04800 [Candidatus Firestonebacteria bacterium RIFOXYA2_FULL_40_8]|nr:MAG: hypothetical protein A2231_04800 [Candidatus Firestonebacteria bacterium RIFOXYA2_FULL_40_8]